MKVVIIHRDCRTDRKQNVESLCKLFPNAQIFKAVEPEWETDSMKRAVRGCVLSHLSIIRMFLKDEPLLVLEDDAVLDGPLPSFKDMPRDAGIILYGSEAPYYGDLNGKFREVISSFFGTHAVLYLPSINHTKFLTDAALLAASVTFGGNMGSLAYEGLLIHTAMNSRLRIYRPDVIPFTTMPSVSDTFGIETPVRSNFMIAHDSDPLLPWETWDDVFKPHSGKRVHLLHVGGNQGDLLINAATRQLFKHHAMVEVPIESAEVVFYPGGGSIAGRYSFKDHFKDFHTTSLTKVCLPQTWERHDSYGELADEIWVRDHHSLKFCKRAKYAPDLALAYRNPISIKADEDVGVFFRNDAERSQLPVENNGDPCVGTPHSHLAYIMKASEYKSIHTNRLHFAIAGLILGRDVTLYPNDYHKNRSVWESSLKDLGCKWKETYQPE